MTPEDVAAIAESALSMTSAKRLRVEFAFLQDSTTWIVLYSLDGQEFAVRADACLPPKELEEELAHQVRQLF